MIESHQNGIRTKAMNPNTPVTYEEVVEDAIRCWDAGASAIHVHNTNSLGSARKSCCLFAYAWPLYAANKEFAFEDEFLR